MIYSTEKCLNTKWPSEDDIAKRIQILHPNKTHGYDQIIIRMMQICGKTICKPLECLFRKCLNTGLFPLEWKKGKFVPVCKKDDKQCLKIIVQFDFYQSVANFLKNNLI